MINFSKTKTSWWLVISLIVFIIITGLYGFQWWQVKGELVKQIEQNENLKQQIEILQKEIKELKVLGWKTYRNEEYKYEVKYPKDWYIYEESPAKVYFQKGKEEEIGFETQPFGPHSLAIEIAVIENPSNLTPKEWAAKEVRNGVTIGLEEEILIGGMPGIKIIPSCENINCEFPIAYVVKNLKIYRFDQRISGEPEIFNQIISTFRFIK